MASIAYCEQVGVNRQPPVGPKRKTCAGEIVKLINTNGQSQNTNATS